MNQFDYYKDINGIPEGIYYGQNDRVEVLNDRLCNRQFSDMPMKPYYDPRPVPTKYSLFPVINRVKEVKESKLFYLDHNVEINFVPTHTKSHCNGYFNNIDNENNLRNQNRYLQKFETKHSYIPKTSSELYNVSLPTIRDSNVDSEHMHPLLFEKPQLETKKFPYKISKFKLNNHTREQLRNL